MTGYAEQTYQSADGLKLYYRDYGGKSDKPVVLCMPGLTRNSADFEDLAELLAPDFRVLCADQRGRGKSEYAKDSATYSPLTYVEDMKALLAHAGVDKVILIGTSLGGLMSMIMAASMADNIQGIIINDIGPDLAPDGISRILEYIGKARKFASWEEAAAAIKELQATAFPDLPDARWMDFAKRTCVERNDYITTDYDPRIAEPFKDSDGTPAIDLWPLFDVACQFPLLSLRGEYSDILTEETFAKMQKRCLGMKAQTVKRVGHAPILDEPDALSAIRNFLNQFKK
ncbi:MAG: alpha/beta hydrolase [Sphingomonadales bacterium]|jgi:pimeloyl-ACP methyl ester carboxylesterase